MAFCKVSRGRILALASVGLLMPVGLCAAFAPAGDPPELTAAWSVRFDSEIRSLVLAPDGGHLGVVTGDELVVMDTAGSTRWRIPRKAISPYLSEWPHTWAVAPGGEWLVVSGDAGYKFVWIVRKDGRKWHFKTAGTPMTIAISPCGDRVAVGTSCGRVHLLSPLGKLLRDIDAPQIPMVSSLRFTPDGRHLIIHEGMGVGVYRLDGTKVWGQGSWRRLEAAPDLMWFVALFFMGHGPPYSLVELQDAKGEKIWNRSIWSGQILMDVRGETVLVSGPEIHDEKWPLDRSPEPVRLLDRKGEVLAEKILPCHRQVCPATGAASFVIRMYRRENDTWSMVGLDRRLEAVWRCPYFADVHFHPKVGLVWADGVTLGIYSLPASGQ